MNLMLGVNLPYTEGISVSLLSTVTHHDACLVNHFGPTHKFVHILIVVDAILLISVLFVLHLTS